MYKQVIANYTSCHTTHTFKAVSIYVISWIARSHPPRNCLSTSIYGFTVLLTHWEGYSSAPREDNAVSTKTEQKKEWKSVLSAASTGLMISILRNARNNLHKSHSYLLLSTPEITIYEMFLFYLVLCNSPPPYTHKSSKWIFGKQKAWLQTQTRTHTQAI